MTTMYEKNDLGMDRITCSGCGSENIFCDHLGYYVCYNCGLTVDEKLFDSQPAYLHTRNHDRVSSTQPLLEIGTQIGKSNERSQKFNRLQTFQNRSISRNNRLCVDYKYQIKSLKANFHVGLDDELFVTEFKKNYAQLPSGTKMKNIRIFSTTMFIQVCRASHISLNIKDVLISNDVSVKDFFAAQQLLENKPKSTFELSSVLMMDYKLIQSFVAEHHLGQAIYDESITFLNSSYLKLGTKASVRACAALSVIVGQHPEINLKSYQIANDMHVSMSRIYSIISYFDAKPPKVSHPKVGKAKMDRVISPVAPEILISNSELESLANPKGIKKPTILIPKISISTKIQPAVPTPISHFMPKVASPSISFSPLSILSKLNTATKRNLNPTHLNPNLPKPKSPRSYLFSNQASSSHPKSRVLSTSTPEPSLPPTRQTIPRPKNPLKQFCGEIKLSAITTYFQEKARDGPPHHPSCWQIIRQLQQEDERWKT